MSANKKPRRSGYHKRETGIKQGRPELGVTKKVSITLDEMTWAWIGEAIDFGHARNQSELLRNIITDASGTRDHI